MIQASFEKTGAGKLPVYVIGHQNPDTDAICSAIGCAELLRMTRDQLYDKAKALGIPGRSMMTKLQLQQAVREAVERGETTVH